MRLLPLTSLLAALAVSSSLTAVMAAAGSPAPTQPNVLLIISDDLRCWLGCYDELKEATAIKP